MRPSHLLAVIAVLALSPLAIAGDAPKGMWDACGEGTWVETKTTSSREMPGMTLPANVSETRQTLVKVTDAEWVMKTERKAGGAWTGGMEIKITRIAPKNLAAVPTPEDVGSESVTVEGKEYPCKKTKLVFAGMTTVSWVSADQGVLKTESQMLLGATATMQVTSLSKKATVAGKEIACRESKTVSKGPGSEMSSVTLSSDAVPTHTVRQETTTAAGPAKIHAVTEVTAFEIK